ncbi:MAG: bifunctional heptose 7-phosphate kinase/heptose 1-phosphate adenyltransferase, partial [Candidatus Cloacimonetes bacterium]|nr:bifunctional heptose 7-phosphate kinase/heptose 1-phosphate adenyltransferase [Candidatus Cloacimonadota bacterium]
GAGDTVISALSLAYAAGAEIADAAAFASYAAGVVCGKMGTASASAAEILEYIHATR